MNDKQKAIRVCCCLKLNVLLGLFEFLSSLPLLYQGTTSDCLSTVLCNNSLKRTLSYFA